MNTDEHDDPAEPSERAGREALAWHVRLNDPVAGATDRTAFGEWLRQSPDHHRAYAEAEELWARLAEPAARLGAGGWYRVPSAAHAPAKRMEAPRWRLRLAPAFALATSVALVVTALWWRDPGLVDRALADYATAPGERREAVLADGSRLVLDGDSAVSVTLDGTERRVDLRRGRVWVDVVHKPEAGFSVRAGGVEARVLGTAFDVDRQDGAVTVTVERGRVAVAARGRTEDGVVLTAGQRVRMIPGQPAAAQVVSADTAFAWRRGLLVFDRAPLGDVAVALSRMSAGRVLIADDALRGLTLSGVFRADDGGAVLDALRSAMGVKTSGVPGVATLIHR